MGRKRKKSGTYESEGDDARSAAEIEADILKTEQEAGKLLAGEGDPEDISIVGEPEVQETPQAEPDVEYDADSGLPIKPRPEPETPEPKEEAPREPAPEPKQGELPDPTQAEMERYGFKSREDVYRAWKELSTAYGQEKARAKELEGGISEQRERLARLEGMVQGAFEPKPEPQLSEEQLAELMSNPGQYAHYVQQQTERRLDEKYQKQLSEIREQMEVERTHAQIKERQTFALTHIPELKALADAGSDVSQVDPIHLEFRDQYVGLIREYPDLAGSNDKMLLAADAVRHRLYKTRKTEGSATPAERGAKKKPAKEDVFLESTSGPRSPISRKKFADMTAAEMERVLPSVDID